MKTMRILFLVLSVVTTFNRNDVSAANPDNQIEYLLEMLIQKVDALEKNTEKQIENVNSVVSKVDCKVDELKTEVKNIEIKMAKEGGSNCILFVFVIQIYVSSLQKISLILYNFTVCFCLNFYHV